MNQIELIQNNLKAKFKEIEDLYYPIVDELLEKLYDLDDTKELPMVELLEFSFVEDWHQGNKSSYEVYNILADYTAHLEDVAKAKLTRRLKVYGEKNPELNNYVKPIIEKIEADCVSKMVQYITTLRLLFSKMAAIDEDQMPISWFEQDIAKNAAAVQYYEMPLNQVIRHIDYFISKETEDWFYLNENVIVFINETKYRTKYHWLMGPENYMKIIRNLYEINDKIKSDWLKGNVAKLIKRKLA